MNNRFTYIATILFTFFIFSAECDAQIYSTKNKRAIRFFYEARRSNSPSMRRELFRKAIKADDKFVEAYRLLATDYARMDSMMTAIEILKPIAANPELDYYSEVIIDISDYYYLDGKYQEAIDALNALSDARFFQQKDELIKKNEEAIEMLNNPHDINPKNLRQINTPFDDYFPSITADGMMLSTTVLVPTENEYGFARNEYGLTTRHQEDIYVSYKNGDEWGKSKRLPYPLNTADNEGAQSFSIDGRYMFFVSCGNIENIGSCDMYYAIRQGKGWGKPINLGSPANTKHWESNPVMSPTGDKIYFSTNRPGGLGSRDIWSVDVEILKNGLLKCSNARPLGTPVNSVGGEFSPYIHADNKTLYFSSNGHGGMARSDIFVSKKENGKWTEPVNLGYPINTYGDESGFTVSGDGKKAYFASNKIEKNGMQLEIYEIDLPEEFQPSPMSFIQGHVVDAKTVKPLQSMVEIFNLQTNEKYFESITDSEDGTFTVYLPAEGEFGMSVSKENYLFYSQNINRDADTLKVLLQRIEKGSGFVLKNLYYGFDSDVILETSWVEIERLTAFLKHNKSVRIEIIGHTDNQGSKNYNQDLSERRALALKNKLIEKGIAAERLDYKGLGDTQPIADNATEDGKARNRRVEIMITE